MEFCTSIEKFNKRAAAKFSQEPLLQALISLDTKYKSRYTDTINCSELIHRQGGKLTARYCRNRWCKVCNRIRTGKLINGYSEILEQMPDKQFVTLTLPNVPAEKLRTTIVAMNKICRRIQQKRRQKDKLPGINAIRKIECTYNPDKNNYHPHYHFIVSTREEAQYLLKNWLLMNPEADIKGQDIREAYNPLELFKYFTKLTSKTAVEIRQYKSGKLKITNEYMYPEAIDIIFRAIEKIRIIQPMGAVHLVKEDPEEIEAEEIDETISQDPEDIFYLWSGQNWYSPYTGQLLTSFKPTQKNITFAKRIRYLQKEPAT